MTDLPTRLEGAAAGSRDLDAEVARAVGWSVHNARRNGLWVVTDGRTYDDLNPLDDNSGVLSERGWLRRRRRGLGKKGTTCPGR